MDVKRAKKVCSHDPRSKSSTLRKTRKTIMVYPRQQDYICTICHQVFRYQFDTEGTPVLVKD